MAEFHLAASAQQITGHVNNSLFPRYYKIENMCCPLSPLCGAADLLLHPRTRRDKHLEEVRCERPARVCCAAQRVDISRFQLHQEEDSAVRDFTYV